MRKIVALFLIVAMVFVVSSCATSNQVASGVEDGVLTISIPDNDAVVTVKAVVKAGETAEDRRSGLPFHAAAGHAVSDRENRYAADPVGGADRAGTGRDGCADLVAKSRAESVPD